MTPTELKTAREELGLSAQAFARLIGVHDGRTVRRWEHGEAPIPGLLPLFLRMRAFVQDAEYVRITDRAQAEKLLELPKRRLTA